MYRRARLRLTAWYAATMLVVLLALGGGTYLGLVWALDREVDAGIRAVVEDWRADAPRLEGLEALDIERHFEGTTSDVFLLVFREDGALVANPAEIEADEILESGLVKSALNGQETWSTVSDEGRFRLWAVPVTQDGRIAGAVIGARSLSGRDESVRIIVSVLGVVAGAGFVTALAAAYVLAGRAIEPLRRAHERERAFVGDASHELRSPLTLTRALGELLQRGSLDRDQRATVDQLIAVTDEASALVDDLLALARSETMPEHDGGPTDLAELAAETLDRLAPLIEAHDCTVERELNPAAVRVSETEGRRVVQALLENVLMHTPTGSRARVRTRLAGGLAHLTVEDDGPGVPAEQLHRIFERFAQVNVARTPGEHGGAGLGLAIVDAIARRHGGQATARSSLLGGLEVEVELPSA
jgi:signal transduction histidine kinase